MIRVCGRHTKVVVGFLRHILEEEAKCVEQFEQATRLCAEETRDYITAAFPKKKKREKKKDYHQDHYHHDHRVVNKSPELIF